MWCYDNMVTNVSEKKLKGIIKESVREALQSELMQLRALFLPEVSNEEQNDIEKRYGKPSRKSVG
jgi:hypothetical protein